jgi:hypothetical protein
MLITDLIVEVRGPNFERLGQIPPEDLVGATFISRFNNVGSWELKIPATARLADELRTPGYGLVLTGPTGVIISGFTLAAELAQTTEDPTGTWTIRGADDSLILAERLAYPTPATADVTAQSVANDIRTGAAETILKEYVSNNIGPEAPSARRIDNLLIEEDLGRGPVSFGSARFIQLQELLNGIATAAGLGYTVEQADTDLEFKVFEPVDRSQDVRMDIANNLLSQTDYNYSSPNATRLIVGGQGEAQDRVFFEGTTPESLEAEELWLRRIERFKDRRDSEELTQLEQAAFEDLTEQGITIVNMSVSPTDEQTMRYGVDWDLGDQVTVVVNDLEAVAVVTEVGISIGIDGVRVGATVGNPTSLDFESKLIAKTQTQDQRISNLERNTTGFGISVPYEPEGGTIGGTQPTFSGPAFTASYTRFGNMVYFSIQVDFDNIVTFGTGHYFLTLPYNSKNEVKFAEGCLHAFTPARDYQIRGAVLAGSNVMTLATTGIVGQRIFDVNFTSTDPVTLTANDFFHIAGVYEIGE